MNIKPPQAILGIDISKDSFHATLISINGEDLNSWDDISSSQKSLKDFANILKQLIPMENLLVVMEHTGVYSLSVAKYFHRENAQVVQTPPQLISRINVTRKAKNDRVDSEILAEYGMRYWDTLRLWKPKTEELQSLENLLFTRESFLNQRISIQQKLESLKRRGALTEELLFMWESQIETLNHHIKSVSKRIEEFVKQQPEMNQFCKLASSVPGIRTLASAELMVSTHLLEGCTSASQLRSYLGVAPLERQSGSSMRSRSKSSGFGPSRIRRILHLAARTVTTHYPEFREYYMRKLAEGKAKMLVLNNVINKLLKILWAVIKSGKVYNPGFQSIEPRLLKMA